MKGSQSLWQFKLPLLLPFTSPGFNHLKADAAGCLWAQPLGFFLNLVWSPTHFPLSLTVYWCLHILIPTAPHFALSSLKCMLFLHLELFLWNMKGQLCLNTYIFAALCGLPETTPFTVFCSCVFRLLVNLLPVPLEYRVTGTHDSVGASVSSFLMGEMVMFIIIKQSGH